MTRMVIVEDGKLVTGLAPIVPSSSTPDYITLKDIGHVTILIQSKNATTVTGSAITLHQAVDVAGTSEKALSFDTVYLNDDTAADDELTKTDVVSDTFTLDDTDSKDLLAVIELDADELDTNADTPFDCLRVGTADATAQTISVTYICTGIRYGQAATPSAIVD